MPRPQTDPLKVDLLEKVRFENFDLRTPEKAGNRGLTIQTVDYREIVASNHPYRGTPPVPTYVPPGYGIYFMKAVNNGWTDNGDNGSNPPLSGWWFEHAGQYLYNARRAQLVALAGNGYVAYEPEFDWSIGGRYYYPNRDSSTWELFWYMNDDTGDRMYENNRGTANIDVVVFRINS